MHRTEVQDIIWNIMVIIKPIIEKHNWKYFMLGGTLLGAVRHGGFIPWDDDIDIGMPRNDYEQFIKVISAELPDYLKLNTYFDESEHHYYFSRIVDTRHEIIRKGSVVNRVEDVWIDIFPLDGMPNNKLRRRIHMMKLLYVRARYHISTFDKVNLQRPDRPLSERIIIGIVKKTHLGTNGNFQKWLQKIDRLLCKYPVEESDWVCNFMGQYKFKEMFPKAWYGSGKMYAFEDSMLSGPIEYDKLLTQQYGDYMTPPENKNAHAAEFIK